MGSAPAAIPARSTVSMGLGVTERNTSGRRLPLDDELGQPAGALRVALQVEIEFGRGRPPEGAFHDRRHRAGVGHVQRRRGARAARPVRRRLRESGGGSWFRLIVSHAGASVVPLISGVLLT